jgi:hypothetical protein
MERYDKTKVCAQLRSKNMYANTDPAHIAANPMPSTEIFWCNLTMQVCGPDDSLCDSDTCVKGRWCYRSILDV